MRVFSTVKILMSILHHSAAVFPASRLACVWGLEVILRKVLVSLRKLQVKGVVLIIADAAVH